MTQSELIDTYQKLLDDGYNPNHIKVTPEAVKLLILLQLEELTSSEDISKVYNFMINLLKEKEDKV